jgi:hypothetical protein
MTIRQPAAARSATGRTTTGPDFVVAGAARAGTTALVEGLRRHPEVFLTAPKEPHYFALHGREPDFRGPGDDRHLNQVAVTRLEDYLALYPTGGTARCGEGSVSTLYYHERALPEILRMNPDLRVVVLLREPVERAWSSFQYLRNSGREPLTDFLAAVAAEPARRDARWHHLWHYTAMSHYADALDAFRSTLGRDQVGVWFHDDLDRDHAGTVRDVLRFLEVDPALAKDAAVARVNASGAPRLAWANRAMAWASARPALRDTARRVTTWQFREAVRTRLLRRDDVPTAARRELGPLFTADLRRLRALLDDGRALPAWLSGAG